MSNQMPTTSAPPIDDLALVILYGGISGEHKVSQASGATIFQAAKGRYRHIEPIGIDYKGRWLRQTDPSAPHFTLLDAPNAKPVLEVIGFEVEPGFLISNLQEQFGENLVVFPALHGHGGEDGSIQSQLQNMGVAYVGSGPQASAYCMNKVTTKKILQENNLPITPYLDFGKNEIGKNGNIDGILSQLQAMDSWRPPYILKPASLGSSIGVTLCHTVEDIKKNLENIINWDDQFIIEPYIDGREIECGILEMSVSKEGHTKADISSKDALGRDFVASPPGEIISTHQIYDYDDKYKKNTAQLIVPADIPENIAQRIREPSIQAAQVLGIEGLARVDFFCVEPDYIVISEVNTMPGWTPISLYPRMFGAAGIKLPELVDRLCVMAIQRAIKM